MTNYKISGSVSDNGLLNIFLGKKYLGYKEIQAGNYSAVFSRLVDDNFYYLDLTEGLYSRMWFQHKNGVANSPVIQNNMLKCEVPTVPTEYASSGVNSFGLWTIDGDFSITTKMVTSSMPNNGRAVQRVSLLTSWSTVLDCYYDRGNYNLIINNVIGGTWTQIASVSIGALPEIELKFTRVGSTTSVYWYNQSHVWTLLASSTTSIGNQPISISLRVDSHTSPFPTGVGYFEYLKVTPNNVIPANFPKITTTFTNSVGKLLGYGQVTPIETTDSVDIIENKV